MVGKTKIIELSGLLYITSVEMEHFIHSGAATDSGFSLLIWMSSDPHACRLVRRLLESEKKFFLHRADEILGTNWDIWALSEILNIAYADIFEWVLKGAPYERRSLVHWAWNELCDEVKKWSPERIWQTHTQASHWAAREGKINEISSQESLQDIMSQFKPDDDESVFEEISNLSLCSSVDSASIEGEKDFLYEVCRLRAHAISVKEETKKVVDILENCVSLTKSLLDKNRNHIHLEYLLAITLDDLSLINSQRLEQYHAARALLRESIKIRDNLLTRSNFNKLGIEISEFKYGLAKSKINLADILLLFGDEIESRILLRQAGEVLDFLLTKNPSQPDLEFMQSWCLNLIGDCATFEGDFESAKTFWQEACVTLNKLKRRSDAEGDTGKLLLEIQDKIEEINL